jgi:hypothetical protein
VQWRSAREPGDPAGTSGPTATDPARSRELVRSLAAALAVLSASVGLVMWLLSFVPGAPTADYWAVVVMPAVVSIFPVWIVTLLEVKRRQAGRSPLRSAVPIPLRGWRLPAGAALFLTLWLSFMLTGLTTDIPGGPEEHNGRYYANDHGVLTAITRAEWEEASATSSRGFAGAAVMFAGLAALYLTQPDAPVEAGVPKPARGRASRPVVRWLQELGGFAELESTGKGPPDALLARMRQVVPARERSRPSSLTIEVHADWDQTAGWPTKAYPLRLDGTISGATQTTATFRGTVQAATGIARLMTLASVLGSLGVAAIGGFLAFLPGQALVARVLLLGFAAFALTLGILGAVAGRTSVATVRRDLIAAVEGAHSAA